jgi:hypothetical protein
MKIFYPFALLLVILFSQNAISANVTSSKITQLPGQFYMVLYVESVDQDNIQAFISELETLPNKIISVTHNSSTHEFTIVFTELIRNDTIYQILLKYFADFEEVDGYYIN